MKFYPMSIAVLLVASSQISAQAIQPRPSDLEFDSLEIFYETNATDMDAEVVIAGEGPDPMRNVKILDPDGSPVVRWRTSQAETLGLIEFEFESAEPSIDEVLARYPDGIYVAVGRTMSGKRVYGAVEFTSEVLDAPTIDSCDTDIDTNNAVISWEGHEDADAIMVEVENDDLEVGAEFSLSGDAVSLTLSPELLEAGNEYDLGVGYFNEAGNLIVSECSFNAI